ncbi:PerC family transcriptional regulator [Escherichia coli]
MITDKKAEELEQRGLWRRAAARWQELLLNYLQEDDRICIQRRIPEINTFFAPASRCACDFSAEV